MRLPASSSWGHVVQSFVHTISLIISVSTSSLPSAIYPSYLVILILAASQLIHFAHYISITITCRLTVVVLARRRRSCALELQILPATGHILMIDLHILPSNHACTRLFTGAFFQWCTAPGLVACFSIQDIVDVLLSMTAMCVNVTLDYHFVSTEMEVVLVLF